MMVGPLLKKWRVSRNLSQERLAEIAEISTRHLSFVETGKSSPSREMVLVLGNALELPLRSRNELLLAAGFAPVYRSSPLEGDDLAPVRRALDHILKSHEPFPAIVVDRTWNLLQMNNGARRLLAHYVQKMYRNALDALFDPAGVRPFIVNWEEVAGGIIQRLHHEIAIEPEDRDRVALLASLLAYPDVPSSFHRVNQTEVRPFVSVHLRRDGVDAQFFTTLTTLGTPLDVTAEELRIESWFASDEATERFVRGLAQSEC